ncbi:MAG: tetratricopeptide repeat protein [Deltaproteobacteria bacterium]|nr:tetratricopeptide repeat protein [Deltaproteobacteria bacterium]
MNLQSLAKSRAWVILPFIVLAVLIYSNTLNAPLQFDDDTSILKNPYIRLTHLSLEDLWRTVSGVKGFSKRPVAHLSFALNYYFHRYRVAGYHGVNIAVHVLAGILLYGFIKTTLTLVRTSGNAAPVCLQAWTTPSGSSMIALLSALLWLVHPIQTQSVTYIVQRMNSMAAMFFILSMVLYIKGRLSNKPLRRAGWFSGCALSGLLALGSKEIAATLPFFILLYEWFFFQHLTMGWLKRNVAYMAGLSALLCLLLWIYLGGHPIRAVLSGYRYHEFTVIQRVLTEFRVIIHYISLLVYPHPSRLNFDYNFSLSHGLMAPPTTALCMAGILGALAWAVGFAKRQPVVSFCVLWFFGNLVIESSVIGLEIIYEHRVYLPSMLFFLPVLILIDRYCDKKWALFAVVGAVILVLGAWTYQRNAVWRDTVTFWTDCVKKSGRKPRPYNNLGLALYKQGRIDEARHCYQKALQLNPRYPQAHNNLGAVLVAKGELDKAVAHYLQALQIRPHDAEVYNNLGSAYYDQGKLDEAVACYSEALRIDPMCVDALNNLGLALAAQEKYSEALKLFLKAVKLMPEHVEARNNLGTALFRLGRVDEAIVQFSEALRINPKHQGARRNLHIARQALHD